MTHLNMANQLCLWGLMSLEEHVGLQGEAGRDMERTLNAAEYMEI